jgi:hypothetical protein
MSDYGGSGMPKTVILAGSAHKVYFNENNSLNSSNFTAALNNAITGSALTYTIKPANTATLIAPFNDVTVKDIFQVNTGNAQITLKWESVEINLPLEWQYSMCDFGTCHPGIPAGPTTMDPVPVGSEGLLGLNIDPGTTAGSGYVKALVYQDGFKSLGDTLTWYVSTPVGAGLDEDATASQIKFYPNPAADKLNIRKANLSDANGYISDASGRKVLSFTLSSNESHVNVADLPAGLYILNIESADKTIHKRITISR